MMPVATPYLDGLIEPTNLKTSSMSAFLRVERTKVLRAVRIECYPNGWW